MVKLLTGNDVLKGHVLWFTGSGWSRLLAEAAALETAEGEALIASEQPKEQISDLALIDAEPNPAGGYRPKHIRERIRGYGPTVRPDLAIADQEWR